MTPRSDLLVLMSVEVDPSTIALNADGSGHSRIQVAKKILKAKKGNREFSITTDHLDQMITNSQRTSTQIPLDYNHLSLVPTLPEQSVAAGWFTKLEREGDNLFGEVDWTAKAVKHLQAKEFRYVSPTINFSGRDEQGEEIGATLLSAALTIYPFLKGMAPVALTELIADKIVLADLSIDERRSRLSEAVRSAYGTSDGYGNSYGTYIPENGLFDDYVVYMKDGKCYRVNYKVKSDFSIEFSGEPKEVVVQWDPVAANALPSGVTMPPTATDQNADLVALRADLQTLSQTVTTLRTDLNAANATAKTEKERADKLQEKLSLSEAESAVAGLVRERKIKVDDKDHWVKLHMSNKEMFTALSATLQASPLKLNAIHGSNEDDVNENERGKKVDGEKKLHDAAKKYIADNGGSEKVNLSDAIRAVTQNDPALALAYRQAFDDAGPDDDDDE